MMKDFYSFHADKEDLKQYYQQMKTVYRRVFDRVGIGEKTYLTFASGGSFSQYSHEFQTITPAGEDTIHICPLCNIAINDEIIAEQKVCPQCGGGNLIKERAIEVGNIFELNTKFSAPFNLTYKNEKGEDQEVIMGCYGIGLGRVMGTVVEALADEQGLVWPLAIAPFSVHLLSFGKNEEAEKIYHQLQKNNIETLFDDRDSSVGEKLADADLVGIPYRLIISEKSLKNGGLEIKARDSQESKIIKKEELAGYLAKLIK